MNHKTKRTLLSSSVIIVSVIICFICTVVLVQAFRGTEEDLSEKTSTPVKKTPAVSVPIATPVTMSPAVSSNATPTQTYHNSAYSTAPQSTGTPNVTISVTETPKVTETPVFVDATLTSFKTKLIAFDDSTATYEVTMRFNAGGTVRMVAVNVDQYLTTTDINPNFIRNAINGADRDLLSTPESAVSGVADANTDLTLQIKTGLKPVDFFIIIDTDVENGLMANSIVQKSQGANIPKIVDGDKEPALSEESGACYLVFDVELTQDATVFVNLDNTTLKQATAGNIAHFSILYDSAYVGKRLTAYVEYKGVSSGSIHVLSEALPEMSQKPVETNQPENGSGPETNDGVNGIG